MLLVSTYPVRDESVMPKIKIQTNVSKDATFLLYIIKKVARQESFPSTTVR